MKVVLIVLAIGATLAGCSTTVRHRGEGSALPRDAYGDVATRELLPDPQHDRARYWSIRDFVQPRGLL